MIEIPNIIKELIATGVFRDAEDQGDCCAFIHRNGTTEEGMIGIYLYTDGRIEVLIGAPADEYAFESVDQAIAFAVAEIIKSQR